MPEQEVAAEPAPVEPAADPEAQETPAEVAGNGAASAQPETAALLPVAPDGIAGQIMGLFKRGAK